MANKKGKHKEKLPEDPKKGPNWLKNKYKKVRQRENRKEKKIEQKLVQTGMAALTLLELGRAIDTAPEPGEIRPKPTEDEVPPYYLVHRVRKVCCEAVDKHFAPDIPPPQH